MQMMESIDGRLLYELTSAWVVTWKYFSHEDAPEQFVCIFESKTRPDYILRRIEQHYVSERLSFARQLAYADERDSLQIHEQAHYVLGTYKNEIWCGLHPTLYARKVETIRAIRDTMGKEQLVWDDTDHSAARAEILDRLSKQPADYDDESGVG